MLLCIYNLHMAQGLLTRDMVAHSFLAKQIKFKIVYPKIYWT